MQFGDKYFCAQVWYSGAVLLSAIELYSARDDFVFIKATSFITFSQILLSKVFNHSIS